MQSSHSHPHTTLTLTLFHYTQDYKEKARDVYAAKKAEYKLELKEKEQLKKPLVKKDVEDQQDAPPDLA